MLENWAKLLGLAAILSATLCVCLLWALNYMPPQNTEWACEAKADSNEPNKPALNAFTCHTKQPENLKGQTTQAHKKGEQNAPENIKITDEFTAIFAGLLVLVTSILIAVGIDQSRQLKRAVDAARTEFISTHRPILRIRRIYLREPLAINQTIKIRILVANIGGSEATICSLGLSVYVGDAAPATEPAPYPLHKIPIGLQAIIDWEGAMYTVIENARVSQGENLCALGIIGYQDEYEALRSTAFARRYDARRRRFIPLADDDPESDREYEN